MLKCLTLLDEMEAVGQAPNARSYAVVIRSLESAGKPAEALIIFDRMSEQGVPRVLTHYNNALRACDKSDQHERALVLLEELKGVAKPNLFSYSPCLNALKKAGRWASALEIVDEVPLDIRTKYIYYVSKATLPLTKFIYQNVGKI